MTQLSWDNYFINIAETVASKSSCLRRQVGCVVVRDKHILSTGYNGPPTGLAHCEDPRCKTCGGSGESRNTSSEVLATFCRTCNGTGLILTSMSDKHCLRIFNGVKSGSDSIHNCRGVHAEANAIIQAAKHGVSIKDAVLYCINKPCFTCSKMLLNAGVKTIYYKDDYLDQHEILNHIQYVKVD
jgi:dCMP deaminase